MVFCKAGLSCLRVSFSRTDSDNRTQAGWPADTAVGKYIRLWKLQESERVVHSTSVVSTDAGQAKNR